MDAGNNLGVLYAQEGRTQDAVAILERVLERNPGAGSVLLNLARLDLSLKRPDAARTLLEGWLARHPGDAAARELIARIRPY